MCKIGVTIIYLLILCLSVDSLLMFVFALVALLCGDFDSVAYAMELYTALFSGSKCEGRVNFHIHRFFFGSTNQRWERKVGTCAWFGPIGTADGEIFQITLSTLPIGSNRASVLLPSTWVCCIKKAEAHTHTHAHDQSPILLT
jgi:hypothetical protein